MGSSAGLDPALLIEPELFAQEEILGRERASDRKQRSKSARGSDKADTLPSQSSLLGCLFTSFKFVTIYPVSSPAGNFCGAEVQTPQCVSAWSEI